MRIGPVFCALFLAASAVSGGEDRKAVEVGNAMIAAMGGEAGWQKARYFRFDFTVIRDGKTAASFSHWWDRYDGRYRVEGVGRDGAPWKAVFNVKTKEGEYFVNGVRAAGETKAKGLEDAYGRFINDTYWLLAPWKVFDPGVHLEYAGVVRDSDGRDCDEIKLSFENVGLTPKDVYWLDIDRTTHRLAQWKFVLNGSTEPPSIFDWKDWRRFGPIELSTSKPSRGRPVEIRFENVAVSETPDDSALAIPR
jgi:hypothetical protein